MIGTVQRAGSLGWDSSRVTSAAGVAGGGTVGASSSCGTDTESVSAVGGTVTLVDHVFF